MGKARILAVDDQRYFRSFLEEQLNSEGYEVRSVDRGSDALELLAREDFDVVLTDVAMQGLAGTELVERVRATKPDQDVIVVTSVGDVRIAVDAMRAGASDYLLTPIDPALLSRSLDTILQRRRLRDEHASLMAENLEYLGTLSLYERSMALFSTRQLEPLSQRILDGLCLELNARAGQLWIRDRPPSQSFRCMACLGSIGDGAEPGELSAAAFPAPVQQLARTSAATEPAHDEEDGEVLWVGFHQPDGLAGVARLLAPQPSAAFTDRDRVVAERFAAPASIAIANATRTRDLERQSFRDPETQIYTRAFFDDVVMGEIRKAGRFGRTFSWLTIELDPSAANQTTAASGVPRDRDVGWVTARAGRVLRTSDLLASDGTGRFDVLLPETDALGAAVLKRRVRDILARGATGDGESDAERAPRLAVASFPFDGVSIEALAGVLERRLAGDAHSLLRTAGLAGKPFPSLLASLPRHGTPLPKEGFEPTLRFVLAEVDRRAGERSMLALAPGTALAAARESITRLDSLATRCEIVLVTDVRADFLAGAPVTVVSPQRIGCAEPFLFYYAEGPAYGLVGDTGETTPAVFWQTADRTFVEELAFQLAKALGMSIGRSTD